MTAAISPGSPSDVWRGCFSSPGRPGRSADRGRRRSGVPPGTTVSTRAAASSTTSSSPTRRRMGSTVGRRSGRSAEARTSLPSVAGPWNVFVEGDNLAVLPGLDPAGRPDLHRPAVQHGQRLRLPRPLRRARRVGGDDAAAAGGFARGAARDRRDLRQHRRQRGRPPAAAPGRGVRRAATSSRRSWSTSTPRAASSGRASRPATSTCSRTPATPAAACWTRRPPESVDPARLPLSDSDGRPLPAPPAAQHQQEVQPGHRADPALPGPRRPGDGPGRAPTPFAGSVEVVPVFGDGAPAVWRWSRPRIDERPDDLVCRTVAGRLGERVDVFQKDWLHRDASGSRRKKLRTVWLASEVGSTDTAVAELKEIVGHVFESPKPTGLRAPDPPDHAAGRRGARLLRRQRHHRPRGRAGQRGRRRAPHLPLGELRRADPPRLQRPRAPAC